jgi:hypothetical protein
MAVSNLFKSTGECISVMDAKMLLVKSQALLTFYWASILGQMEFDKSGGRELEVEVCVCWTT